MPALSRRRFLKISCQALWGGLVASGGTALYAATIEPTWLRLRRISVGLPALPASVEGFTLSLLTDLHYTEQGGPRLVEDAVALSNAVEPDVVLLGGDFVTGSAAYAQALIPLLEDLRAPYGVFAVLGNHDIWSATVTVVEALESAGVTVLRDAVTTVGPLQLIGIEDRGATGMTRLGQASGLAAFRRRWTAAVRALRGLVAQEATDLPRLLLVHNPDFAELLPDDAGIELVLSGHIHGGQVQLPLIGAPLIPSCFGDRFLEGLTATSAGTPVYVSHGVGHIPPGVRFNCRPEVTALTLRSD